MNLTDFRLTFPEFAKTADDRVARMLALAAERCDPVAYETQYAQAVGYLAAHMLASSPYGQNARAGKGERASTYYEEHYLELQSIAGCGPRVL